MSIGPKPEQGDVEQWPRWIEAWRTIGFLKRAFITQGGAFRWVEVRSGRMLAQGQQEVLAGIRPGQRVVLNALDLQNTAEN